MYSQSNEELFIREYFKNTKGKFIDIGAFNPFIFSNTRKLYEKGWHGIMVEPSPKCFSSLLAEYEFDPKIELLNYAITEADGEVVFYEANGDAVSTTEKKHKAKWEAGTAYTEIKVPSMSMKKFLYLYGEDTDFISLDTEGANLLLFDLLEEWFLKRIKMICIEHDGHYNYMATKLSGFGFKKSFLNSENIILSK